MLPSSQSQQASHDEKTTFSRPSITNDAQKTTKTMVILSVWMSFAAWIANFDNGYGGTVLIMPSFKKAFGHCHVATDPTTGVMIEECSLSALQQSLIGVGSLFMAVGGAFAGVTGTYIGRKGTIQFACALCIIGAAGMLGTAGNFLNYMVCKCISSVGIGQLMASSIIYGSECTAANKRGLLLGLYNVGLGLGNVTAYAVCAGSATLAPNTNWQWKTPIVCQIPLALILGVGMVMFAESPRWLLIKGRDEAARKSFGIFHQMDPFSMQITAQIEDVKRHIEFENALNVNTSWTEIYCGNNLRRTTISAFILVGLAITGIQFVAPYAALFLSGVGIRNSYLINVIIGLCIFGGSCIGPFVLEYGGRRFSMLVGYTSMALCMLIFSSVSTSLGSTDPVAQKVVVVFLCLWAFIFGGFIGPSVWLASAEMHSVRLRTYGQANTTVFYQIFAFGATFWTPYMLNEGYGNMGPNVGYFYFGVTFIVGLLVFLFVPETARLTLEQIDDYFVSGRMAWRTSISKNKAIVCIEAFDLSEAAKNGGQS
ncbi:mfs monosaccharide transporter protein [Penicillium cataractarum]|uniref:Mfs monosaccharide transporter protein n=1 Tax=Penicillium cataractarum TaxID=2100454 RepID=A0A9W9VIU6_9EURO|nr:mfs monosaccharide transporter protein [Penicillium cataractarum]KAJ5381026.1 mfs monosaccharide transporter protein [Penicillium cataractarum]